MSGGTSHVPDHQHWKPAVPLWGVVYGRIGLGILEESHSGWSWPSGPSSPTPDSSPTR